MPKKLDRNVLHSSPGFTIVELLIVVVIIAILAATAIVAYSGTKQRAVNAAIIDAASKSLRMIQAYSGANGVYPFTNGDACVTITTGCMDESGNVKSTSSTPSTTLSSNIATIGALPLNVPFQGTNGYGVWFTYNTSQTFNGTSQPMRLTYFLSGTNQSCGLSGVVQFTWPNFVSSNTGYTSGNISSSGKTLCWISVSGPAV